MQTDHKQNGYGKAVFADENKYGKDRYVLALILSERKMLYKWRKKLNIIKNLQILSDYRLLLVDMI